MIGIKVKTDNKYAYVTMNFRHIIENNWLNDLNISVNLLNFTKSVLLLNGLAIEVYLMNL